MEIMTASGVLVPLINPRPDHIKVQDIAHSLAHICRWGGHGRAFYSVAEHSYHMWTLARFPNSRYTHQWALLHDAAEAYLGDVVTPLKNLLGQYHSLERNFMTCISDRFDLPLPIPASIWELDQSVMAAEYADLFPNHKAWNPKHPAAKIELQCWTPDQAKKKWLEAWEISA